MVVKKKIIPIIASLVLGFTTILGVSTSAFADSISGNINIIHIDSKTSEPLNLEGCEMEVVDKNGNVVITKDEITKMIEEEKEQLGPNKIIKSFPLSMVNVNNGGVNAPYYVKELKAPDGYELSDNKEITGRNVILESVKEGDDEPTVSGGTYINVSTVDSKTKEKLLPLTVKIEDISLIDEDVVSMPFDKFAVSIRDVLSYNSNTFEVPDKYISEADCDRFAKMSEEDVKKLKGKDLAEYLKFKGCFHIMLDEYLKEKGITIFDLEPYLDDYLTFTKEKIKAEGAYEKYFSNTGKDFCIAYGTLHPRDLSDNVFSKYLEKYDEQVNSIKISLMDVPKGYMLPNAQKVSFNHFAYRNDLDVVFEISKTKTTIKRVDAITNEPVSGATIDIYDKDNKKVAEFISGDKPKDIEGLEYGKVYTAKEINPPENYERAESKKFTVLNNDVITLNSISNGAVISDEEEEIEEENAETETIIEVIDKKTGDPVKNARIRIIDVENNKVVLSEITTGTVIVTSVLEKDKEYTVTQDKTSNGYNPASDITFTARVKNHITLENEFAEFPNKIDEINENVNAFGASTKYTPLNRPAKSIKPTVTHKATKKAVVKPVVTTPTVTNSTNKSKVKSVVISGSDTPTARVKSETIYNSLTPLANATGATHWALANLIITILSVIFTILFFGREIYVGVRDKNELKNEVYYADDRKRIALFKFAGAIWTVLIVVFFIITENMLLPMKMFDKWTLLMAIMICLQMLFAFMALKEDEGEGCYGK